MKRFWKWFCISALSLCAITLAIYYKVYSDVKETVEVVYTPFQDETTIKREIKREKPIDVKAKEPFSALIVGVDERAGDKGRTDTMIVLTVNPTQKSTKMLSIPRDTYTELIGLDINDKINHAYAFGGMEMTINTVEALLDIPIDYAAKVNMESFVEIINLTGNIKVENPFEFDYEGELFPAGELELDGEKALKYVRMRYEDPQGDFGRQNRQKQVIQQIIKNSLSLNTLKNYQSIIQSLENNVEMNIPFEDLLNIQKDYRDSFGTLEQLYLNNGTGKMMNGIYYYVPDEKELKTVQETLRSHLEIK
ncbi:LytR family transcriptional regulator [Lysinibacillus yapensis]|uniref:LytR family transcriptional regulator n=1 Tax=Ureibacillus yapensis TaxID=2304605 RepID=A0A396SEI7_9BACL|nr:LCP family protein [Lysinibacillus yapensis]RHW39532.1 LytR family transcriptional regulator [Lysinibacillus yapensis]